MDTEVDKFVNTIQKPSWKNTSEIRRTLKGNSYPREMLELIVQKRTAGKKWQHSRSSRDKTVLNNLTTQLKEEIKQLKNDTISDYLIKLTNYTNTDYSLWRTTKK